MSLKEKIDLKKLPSHIAVIMDGNGRWAGRFGKTRIFGHTNGVNAVRQTSEACAELGVKFLTLYAFSTENWLRPETEVSALMALLLKTIKAELKTLLKNDIRLKVIGDVGLLPKGVYKELKDAIERTANNTRMDLILALNYSGKSEITRAVKQISEAVKSGALEPGQIDEEMINRHLYTANMPDPELLIRTSGEKRVSNFLLWQLAYAEYYFTDVLWPDFNKEELYKAIIDYQNRERRFGKTSEQIKTT
ncbi:MAG TPA: isoprenyl transferase [Chitinophagales bacterium]|nr:isoprenyl transferase [Chitinophagales bacterium]